MLRDGRSSGAPSGTTAEPAGRLAYAVSKRAIDLAVVLMALLVLLPSLLFILLAVALTSRGPGLFRQVRVGRGGQLFVMYKFRSMAVDTDDSIHRAYVAALLSDQAPQDGGEPGVFKLSRDPRITKLGGLLRRTSLDELPQLLNVLKGEMSLVGPRPALPYELELYDDEHRRRLAVLPGITGLWQVSGRNRLTMRQALELDLEYAARCSTRLDMHILLKTPAALLKSGSAR